MDFAVPAELRGKITESEKIDKYLDLARELKTPWNMRLTVIPIVVGALGTVLKSLETGLSELKIWETIKTIQTTALLRSARILRKVLETWGDLMLFKLLWKTIN